MIAGTSGSMRCGGRWNNLDLSHPWRYNTKPAELELLEAICAEINRKVRKQCVHLSELQQGKGVTLHTYPEGQCNQLEGQFQ